MVWLAFENIIGKMHSKIAELSKCITDTNNWCLHSKCSWFCCVENFFLNLAKRNGIVSNPVPFISTKIYWFLRLAIPTKYFTKVLVSGTVLVNLKIYVCYHNNSSFYGTFGYLAVSFFWQLTLRFYYTLHSFYLKVRKTLKTYFQTLKSIT